MHRELSKQLVRALRAKRSQAPLSRRLGFGTNVLYLWESGRRMPTASHFFQLAVHVGIDVDTRVAGFLGLPQLDASLSTRQGVANLLLHLRGGASVRELSVAVDTDRTTVARWLSAKTEPPLPSLLCWVEATAHRLLDFIALFADPAKLPATKKAYEALLSQRQLAYDDPWSHAVLRSLELNTPVPAASSRAAFIAERLGLSLEQVEAALQRMRRASQIRKRDGRWQPVRALPVDTRTDPDANFRLKRHWFEVVRARLERTRAQGEGMYSYNLFAISDNGFERIRRLHVEYFERLRGIVEEERGGSRVVLAAIQLVPLDE